ncbi:atp-binding cassette transporter sub-family c member 9 [Lasius niger]|uniref:Atp-binding cassette transporter sub-family c member 9 n=1 Tax=Lasius niger TaxID=67767 RepID=A0A0J7NRD9_LASNI|nr:atp-binding cassette transporter sub-family c member 9 [Lasius niger]
MVLYNSIIQLDATRVTFFKVEVINSVTTFGSLDNIVEDEEHPRSNILREFSLAIDSSVDTVFEKDPEVPESVLRIRSSTFAWGSDENTLMINALNFPRGQLTIIVGKTGSGKTSLLLALLGEIQRTNGSIEWTKGLKIAYVAQRPWLQNATLRDNILFGSAYRSRRYRNVLRACALQPDVDILPGRDLTRIGERGINLSGGQKQRVTIARAFYSDADVILLDDPLSALDQHVGRQIFDYGVRKLMLRSGRTVIMVTHRLDLLLAAHQVIVMDSCRVRAVGTKSSIEDMDPELAAEWRIADSRRENENRFQKTAKDRWSLIRLVSRIGIGITKRHASDGSWIIDRDAHVNPPAFIPLRLRRTTLSGSRYLSHDLTDLPVPTEEWNTARKRSKTYRDSVRSTSFQTQNRRPPPVLRQSSTPMILENREHVASRISQQQERDHFPVKRLLSIESRISDDVDDMEETLDGEDANEQNEFEIDDKSGMVTRMTWIEYPKSGGWMPGLVYVVAALAYQILRVYTDLWLSRWTDQNVHSPTNERQNTVSYFKVYIIISVGSILLSFLYNVAGQWAGARARCKLHREAIAGLLGAPISFFDCNPIGKILNRFSADMGVIDKLYLSGFLDLRVADDWPNKGEIVFENVSLRYDVDRNPVIIDLFLKIPAGQKLGICGRTGSGKSSTVMALFQLIEISQGRILLDGIDIRQVPLRILRSRLSAIPQDAIMFSGTIRENLDPLSEHEDQEIWRALELSQVKDVVASHPEGLNLEVREGGENFSAGQLQLLCMARTVLQRSSIIVLDEATSALDVATEKSLLKAAAIAFENKTVITIAVSRHSYKLHMHFAK